MARHGRRIGNLPAEMTSFVGRRYESGELRKKLGTARLVTLVGPGGVGKTRLAIRFAAEAARGFSDGAWFIDLADVQDQTLVACAALAGLDLRDQAAADPLAVVLAYVRDKQLLLVMDNCEHVLRSAADLVSRIMRHAPGVRVIATSREPLTVEGEQIVPVAPLELPSGDAVEQVDRVRQNEAVMLFAERAAAAAGSFELTTTNAGAVTEVCRRLDGLPLAIELAAVRTRVLTVEEIRNRLSDRFGLLTRRSGAALPRHETLKATIDWSHDLLDSGERMLFRRLSTFTGRFTLEDIESVCLSGVAPAADALNPLSILVDRSLVIKEDAGGQACYRLHETMREYARLKLQETGEQAEIEQRCAEYYTRRCRQSAREARYRLLEWFAWIDLEIDNIRSVLQQYLLRRNVESGIEVANSLGWYWVTRATGEGVRWLDRLLADLSKSSSVTAAHARACFLRGFLGVLQADVSSARAALARARTAATESGEHRILAEALSMAAIAENMAGDRIEARRLLDQAYSISKSAGDVPVSLTFLQACALNAIFEVDVDAVRSASSEGARVSREAGDLYTLQHMLINLGLAELLAGRAEESRVRFLEALRLARQMDDRVAQFYALGGTGCCAASSGQLQLAAKLLGAAEKLRVELGASVNPMLASLLPAAEESAIAALGASAFALQFEAGRRLGRDAAVRMALGESKAQITGGTSSGADADVLGKRETEVAGLVAEGLTNKQIAQQLFISDNTVDSHIRHILNKLGINSRAQITSWVASRSSRD
jgi:predicted ATPase/DNA-binding CsgD family transcriptional regulator